MRKLILTVALSFSGLLLAFPTNYEEIIMPGDGNCLYWSLTANRFDDKQRLGASHQKAAFSLKTAIVDALASGKYDVDLSLVLASDENNYRDKQSYIQSISTGALWPGDLELKVASDVLNSPIMVYFGQTSVKYGDGETRVIALNYTGNHYNYLKRTAL